MKDLKQVKIVYIYTDGGYRPLKNIGAYTFHITFGKNKQITKSGYVNSKSLSSNFVEFVSFLKAMQYIKKTKLLTRKDIKIVLYTDSLNLKNVFDGLYFFHSIGILSKKVQSIKTKYGHRIEVVWVPRNKIPEQRWCDRLCSNLLDSYRLQTF